MVVHPGSYMKLHMTLKGLNQKALYKAMKINQATVSLLVNGKQRIHVELALKLEKVLSVPAIYWMHWQAEYEIEKYRREQNGRKET